MALTIPRAPRRTSLALFLPRALRHAGLCLAALASLTLPAAADEVVIDLSPFTPFAAAGEVWGVGSITGEVTHARLDVTLVSNETSPWTLHANFVDFPMGGAIGIDSVALGWSGTGTFSTTVHSDALNGTLAPPPGETYYSWFMQWAGGVQTTLPGGGISIGPMDGVFTSFKLTLSLETCPNGSSTRPWLPLGGALAGALGKPSLSADASLCAGSAGTLTLEHAKPLGTAHVVLGLSDLSAPFKGGVLVPQPDILLLGFPVDAAGTHALGFTWPAGVPSDLDFWVQFWIVDAAAPQGFAASNGLRGTTP